MALELGFAAEFAIDFVHVHGPASFAVGVAPDEGFVCVGPAGVASFNISRLVSAAGEAVAFAIAPVAQAVAFALSTCVVRGTILAVNVAG